VDKFVLIIVIVFGSPVLLWVILFNYTLIRRRRVRLRNLRYERSLYRFLRSPSREIAERAAAERRTRVQAFLRRALELDPEEDLYSGHGAVTEEFLEPLPERPGLPDGLLGDLPRRRFEPEDPSRFWHTAQLLWQLDSDQLLLVGRVMDVVTIFLRRGMSVGPIDYPTHIRLAPVPGGSQESVQFPWRVIIGTRYVSRAFRELFEAIRDWLGIGIEFELARPIHLYGACHAPGDMTGVIGGVIATPAGTNYGVTCRHVLSPWCPARFFPIQEDKLSQPTGYTEAGPDAALITLSPPCAEGNGWCFAADVAEGRDVVPADKKAIGTHRVKKTKLRKCRRGDRRVGEISASGDDVAFTADDGTEYSGPHILVTHQFRRILGIDWPLWDRQFSRPGDSGSWVLTENDEWVGMVVAGQSAPNRITYVTPAYFLVDVFRRALRVDSVRSSRLVV
jgi:hypothetical protein